MQDLTPQAMKYLAERKSLNLKKKWGILETITKSYPIWTAHKVHTDAWTGDVTISASQVILITNLISAKLGVSVRSELASSDGTLWLNNKQVATHDFLLGGMWEETIDVTPILLSGSNTFTYRIRKTPMIGFGDVYITVNLVVEGDVIVGPKYPQWLWPWGVLAVAGAIGIIIIVKKV